MLEFKKKGNIIYSYASGKLDSQDYDLMIPKVKSAIEKHGKIRWYFQVDKLDGWTPDSFWREVKFDVKHRNDLERIAVVGQERWHDWMTQVMKPFTSAEVRYFDETEKDKAANWIENDAPKTAPTSLKKKRKRIRKYERY